MNPPRCEHCAQLGVAYDSGDVSPVLVATRPPMPDGCDHLDVSDSETVRRHAATFRRARLARIAAVEAEHDKPSEEPAPEVPGREASSDEVPRGAASIAKHARAHGWQVREVYSRGPARLGEEPSDEAGVEAVTVRCWRLGEEPSDAGWAFAYYRRPGDAWKLEGCLIAEPSDGLRRVGARELKAFLGQEPSDEPSDEGRLATSPPMR